jgi:hypothetical protein
MDRAHVARLVHALPGQVLEEAPQIVRVGFDGARREISLDSQMVEEAIAGRLHAARLRTSGGLANFRDVAANERYKIRMDPRQRARSIVATLTGANAPVSFLDAFQVVRLARRVAEPDDSLVAGILELSDAPHLTFGARQVLSAWLKGLAQRQAHERSVGARVIKPKDNGKTARVAAGARLRLALSAKPTEPEWQVAALQGPGKLQGVSPATALERGAEYELACAAAGIVELEMTAGGGKDARRFVLRVVVER